MVFLHPEFLWGLLALCIPILIHLFDFRKNRKVYFSDIRFLKEVKHSSRKPLKLKQLLILLSRLAFIIFLVLVFTQPILPSKSEQKVQAGVKLIYIDNSQSMSSLINSKESSFDKAKSLAQKIIEKLPSGQEIIIVNNESINKFLLPKTSKEVSDEISSINITDKAFSLQKLGTALIEYNKRASNLSDVFIISDFQKSTSQLDLNRLDTALTYWLSPINGYETNNAVVDSVYRIDTNIKTDSNIKIEVLITNIGDQQIDNLPVKVFVGSRQISATTTSVPAFQRKTIEFSLGKIDKDESGYIQIEDFPNTFDNTFYFSIAPKSRLNIFEIISKNSSDYVKTVFGNEKLFSTFSNNFQNVDNSLFEKADFVILNQIDKPSTELIEQLKLFTKSGGGLLVVPGLNIDLNSYLNLSGSLARVPEYHKQKINPPSTNLPFFAAILEKTDMVVDMPNVKPILAWGTDRSAILSLEDGSPYLSEVSENMYFVSTPFIDSISSFQSHALFVPVMYGLASQSISPTNQLFSRIDSDFYDIVIDSIKFNDLIKLTKENIEIIPNKVKLGNKWRLSYPKEIITSGIYKVELENIQKGFLAVNLNKEESQLMPLDILEIEKLFSGNRVNILETYISNSTILSSFDSGIALWKYALTICLLFLLIETLLIRFL